MAGTTGSKNTMIRQHLKQGLGTKYKDLDVDVDLFPGDDVLGRNVEAYKKAIEEKLEPGDGVAVFTPDDTHFEIALFAIQRGMHVLIAKPAVKDSKEHKILMDEAEKRGVLVVVELHKRFDPIYGMSS
jgi:D-galacturonate reductase